MLSLVVLLSAESAAFPLLSEDDDDVSVALVSAALVALAAAVLLRDAKAALPAIISPSSRVNELPHEQARLPSVTTTEPQQYSVLSADSVWATTAQPPSSKPNPSQH